MVPRTPAAFRRPQGMDYAKPSVKIKGGAANDVQLVDYKEVDC
jgi:hypothetical protein